MHFQTAHILLLVFTLAGSLFVLIAATRYAMWSRPMINGSSSWLGLCAYVGVVPLISLLYTITHLLLLHLRKIPSFSPSRILSSPGSRPPSSNTTLNILILTTLLTLSWLAQSALCTACELGPIASGTQGIVPQWCPQSRFRETPSSASVSSANNALPKNSSSDRAAMLASLAVAKDVINWVIFVAGLASVECCRRAWKMAQVLEAEGNREGVVRGYDPGVARRFGGGGAGWGVLADEVKGGGLVGVNVSGPMPAYELRNTEPKQQPQQQGLMVKEQKRAKMNSWLGIRGVQDVRVNLKVPGASYDTRV